MTKRSDISKAAADKKLQARFGSARVYAAKAPSYIVGGPSTVVVWVRNSDRALATHGGPLMLAKAATYRDAADAAAFPEVLTQLQAFLAGGGR